MNSIENSVIPNIDSGENELKKNVSNSSKTKNGKKSSKTIKRPRQTYDLVEVWWDDAAGLRHGWMDRSEQPKPQMVISVGFLIVDTTDHIIIAQDTDSEGAHNGRTQIPRGMVKRLRVLRTKDHPQSV